MIVLFRRLAIDKRVLNGVKHHSLTWHIGEKGYMTALSWSLTKGDWWKDKSEESAKFFSWNWKKKSNEFVRTGIYVGRLAIVWQTRPQAIEATE